MHGNFTIKEEKVYETINDSIKKGEEPTVAEIARAASVSPALVIKLSKKLNYNGYTEMFYSMQQAEIKNESQANKMFDIISLDEARDYISFLSDYFDDIEKTSIIIIGVGICDAAAADLRIKLANIGINTHVNINIDSKKSKKLAIFFSESGLVPFSQANQLKKKGYDILSFTSMPQSPLARISSTVIEIPSNPSKVQEYLPNFFTANLYVYNQAIIQMIQSK